MKVGVGRASGAIPFFQIVLPLVACAAFARGAASAQVADPGTDSGAASGAPVSEPAVDAPPGDFVQGVRDRPLGAGPSAAELVSAADPSDWLYHTRDLQGTRYSPLDRIDASNASDLVPACLLQVGDPDNFQTGPVVHDGVMYLGTVHQTLAVDAATCRVYWRHRWRPRDDEHFFRNRGVAIQDGYVVRGTSDGYLVALDADDGQLLWARQVADPSVHENFTMPPMIVGDRIFIGPALSEFAISGWLGAFSLEDGSPIWRFETVPGATGRGDAPWANPAEIPLGGGAVWTPLSMNPEGTELYVAVTNPSPDLPAYLRPGPNLYTNSMVALDPETGRLLWHLQLVPNDDHDWDLNQVSPVFEHGGRQVAATAGKDGLLRLVDRGTREVLWEAPVTTRENVEAPITTEPQRVCPGVLGGVQWNGPALLPEPGLLVVPAVDWCTVFTAAAEGEVEFVPGQIYMGGSTRQVGERRGWLTAISVADGSIRWRYSSPDAMIGAVTTTAGGLVATGEQTGDFVVFDGRTGEELYRFNTGGPIGGGVVSYAVDGRQYLAVASGRPSGYWIQENMGSPTVVVFALPEGE